MLNNDRTFDSTIQAKNIELLVDVSCQQRDECAYMQEERPKPTMNPMFVCRQIGKNYANNFVLKKRTFLKCTSVVNASKCFLLDDLIQTEQFQNKTKLKHMCCLILERDKR